MKKQLLVIARAVFALTACHKEKVNVKAEYDKLYANATAAYEAASSQDEMDAVYHGLIDSTYLLLEANMGEPYTDSLFVETYYMLSLEQQGDRLTAGVECAVGRLRTRQRIHPIVPHAPFSCRTPRRGAPGCNA